MHDLHKQAIAARKRLNKELERIFDAVESRDATLAAKIIDVLEGRTSAAHWFTSKVVTTDGKTPIELVCNGQRDEVIDMLNRIEYGLYS